MINEKNCDNTVDNKIEENNNITEVINQESNDEEIVSLDFEIKNQPEIAYLISSNYNGSMEFSENLKDLPGIFQVNFNTLCRYSGFIKAIVDCDTKNDKMFVVKHSSNNSSQLTISSEETVNKLSKWINYHIDKYPPIIPNEPIKYSNFKKILKDLNINDEEIEWYNNFMKMKNNIFFELLATCNYMVMSNSSDNNNKEENNPSYGGLLNYCCVKVASLIKGNSPEELKEILDINGNNFLD